MLHTFPRPNIGEIGVAFSRLFTAWNFGSGLFTGAFESLGMSAMQLLLLLCCLVAMGLIYHMTEDVQSDGALPLTGAYARVNYNINMSLYIYGIMAVALCWLALLANSDVSGFAYFQF